MSKTYDGPLGFAPLEEWEKWLAWLRTQEPDEDGRLEDAIDRAESWISDLQEEAEW